MSKSMQAYINQPSYITNPLLPITVTVIGAGGTGSQFLYQLASIAVAYKAVHNRNMVVMVWDKDKVTSPNVGRQRFSRSEVGMNKAEAVVSRINRFYGFNWIAVPKHFELVEDTDECITQLSSNYIVTCTDNLASRKLMASFMALASQKDLPHEFKPYYWIDCGNSKNKGQVMVGSPIMQWPNVIEVFGRDVIPDEEEDVPSCTLAMALDKQDLFINTTIALVAAMWLKESLWNNIITWRGAFINLEYLLISKITC